MIRVAVLGKPGLVMNIDDLNYIQGLEEIQLSS